MTTTQKAPRTWLLSLRVVVLYFLFAVIWIPPSDAVASMIADNKADLSRLQTLMGWIWIALTSILLYWLITQALNAARRASDRKTMDSDRIDLALRQVPAILWTTDADLKLTSVLGGAAPTEAGRPLNEGIGPHLGERAVNGPLVRGRLLEAAERALEGEQGRCTSEWRGRTYDTIVLPVLLNDRSTAGVAGLEIDVTEKRRADLDLATSVGNLRRSNQERDRLLRHLLQAEQVERDRIAAGIHDDSIQVMTSAGMALDLLISRPDDDARQELALRARDLVQDAVSGLRGLVFKLKPVELEKDGLAAALRLLLEWSRSESGSEFEIEDNMPHEPVTETRYLIYRIAQEAIMNARKHSKASNIHVCLERADDGFNVKVSDDGCGFVPSGPRRANHFGLKDMEERAGLAGGWWRISSTLGRGTDVEFWIPLQPGAMFGG